MLSFGCMTICKKTAQVRNEGPPYGLGTPGNRPGEPQYTGPDVSNID